MCEQEITLTKRSSQNISREKKKHTHKHSAFFLVQLQRNIVSVGAAWNGQKSMRIVTSNDDIPHVADVHTVFNLCPKSGATKSSDNVRNTKEKACKSVENGFSKAEEKQWIKKNRIDTSMRQT